MSKCDEQKANKQTPETEGCKSSPLTTVVFYLYQLHHRDWVEEMKATESVQPVGGAGDLGNGQRGCVAGKDGVSK